MVRQIEDFKGEIREGKKWIGYGIGENNEYNMIYKEGKIYHYN